MLRLKEISNNIEKVDPIDRLVNHSKYKCTARNKNTLTDEVINKLELFLEENEEKQLSDFSKQ